MPTGNKKVNINIVVMGQFGSGKSTTARKIYNLEGTNNERPVSKKSDKKAAEEEKRSFKYDGAIEKLAKNKPDGIALFKFETAKYLCTVTDVTDRRDFIKNMITGISQADCAILIVDSTSGGSTTAPYKLDEQTREHAFLAYTLGVKEMICCCNKMDATTPRYSEKRYNEIVKSISSYLSKVGYTAYTFIPISGLEGDNLRKGSTNFHWYKDPILLEALDEIREPERHSDKPLRLSLEAHHKIGRNGTIAIGRIETGILKPGMKITIGPTGLTAKVESVRMNRESVQEALPGDIVGIHMTKKKIDLKRGYVASNSKGDPAKLAISFTSRLVILNRPAGCLIPNGYTAMLHCHSFYGSVRFEEIMSKSNLMSGIDDQEKHTAHVKPQHLEKGEIGFVKMVPLEPMVVEAFEKYRPLGHFTITDTEQIVGVGVITSVEKEYGDGGNKMVKKSALIKYVKKLAIAVADSILDGLMTTYMTQLLCPNSNFEEDNNEDNKE